LKPKPKAKPQLVASRSQPNLFAPNMVIQQKLRSSTYSHNSSNSSMSPLSLLVSALTISTNTTTILSAPSNSIPFVTPPNVTIQSAPPPNVTVTTATTMTPAISAAQEEMNKELEKLRGLVPSVPAINLKGLPRSRGLEPNPTGRKLSQSKLPMKKAPLAIHFRKASSEPSLQHLPIIPRGGDNQNNDPEVKRLDPVFLHKIKSIKSEKMRMKETLEDSDKALVNRNNFFMKVIHQEKHHRDNGHIHSEPPNTHGQPNHNHKDENEVIEPIDEAEEKFLRELGWKPDEEDHVPFLLEEEIAEARERLAVAQHR